MCCLLTFIDVEFHDKLLVFVKKKKKKKKKKKNTKYKNIDAYRE